MFDDFMHSLDEQWIQTCIGGGTVQISDSTLRLAYTSAQIGKYSDAQIDDYGKLTRSKFPWRPPLRLEIRARTSHPAASEESTVESKNMLRGTAGFGFWNYPFSARGDILMLPEAVWFFYASPPSNMSLVPGVPGWGWKAQVIHTMRADALPATIPMAMSAIWARMTGITQPAQRWMQRLSGAREALLPVQMTDWHTYVIEWKEDVAGFWVDDHLVLIAPNPPSRPLGFVAWLDNQYAVATPRGILRFGTVSSGPQWLDLDYIKIEPL
jgi:hypothetical protein